MNSSKQKVEVTSRSHQGCVKVMSMPRCHVAIIKWAIIQESTLITRKPLLIDVLSFLSPLTLSAGLYPSKRVSPCVRVAVGNRYFSFNFDSIATKLSHILDQTFPSPACARRDDSSNF